VSAIEDRLTELGLKLPTVSKPVAAYVPAIVTGNLVFTAGQLPFVDGKLEATGKVGAEVSADDAAKLGTDVRSQRARRRIQRHRIP
jgi:enamine deaminase RidA (YjgF/YER057c/UK114 family)